MSDLTISDDGRPFESVEPDDYEVWNAQTEAMVRSSENGQLLAIERGVSASHKGEYSVTRFASPIWEMYEPLEYHGDYVDRSEAVTRLVEVAEKIEAGEIDT